MTDQERHLAFINEYNALVQRYGVQIAAVAVPETFGPIIQIRASITTVLIDDWQAPAEAAKVPELERSA